MSIFVRPLFDPTAQQIVPQGPDTYVMPARSRALQRLADDMYLYAIRAVQGRSFLIAGHRGSGKTSLVNNVLEEVRQRLATSNQYNRLIDIRLHGPDLLSRSSPEATKPVAAEDTRKMLTQVTLAFYQKVADIYAAAYRKRVMTITKGRSEEAVELAAQMRLDLDSAPGLPLLRDYWERAHALETGVLSFDTNETQYTYRGIDELVALACAAQAYQRVVGELTVKDETSDTAKREQKAEYEAKTDLKEAGK